MHKTLRAVLAGLFLVWSFTAAPAMLQVNELNGFNAMEVTAAPPGAGLAIADTNTYSDNSGSVANHPVNLPSSIASGNLLLAFCAFNGAATVTDPSGWGVLISAVNSDTFRAYARIADGSEGSTVSVVLAGNARASCATYRITGNRNGVTSSEIAVSSAVNAGTATPDPPSLSPSWGSDANLWIALTYASDGSFTFTSYPTDYTLGQLNVQTGTGTGNAVSIAGRLLTAASEDPGVFTTVTARTRSTYTLAVRPAP